MAARDVSPCEQVAWPTGGQGLAAHHHGTDILRGAFNLHREIGHVRSAHHAWHAQHTANPIVFEAGGFSVRPLCVLLHHPQVSATVGQECSSVVDHAAVNAGHGQCHADQQAKPNASEDEFLP